MQPELPASSTSTDAPAQSSSPRRPSRRLYLSQPDVGAAEEAALVRALRSGWVAPLGPDLDAFEADLATATGRRFAVGLSSGTAALHLGLLTLGVRPGDLVLTSTFTFAATVNAITYTGAVPVLVDCDESGCLSPELLARAYEDLQRQHRSVAAVVPVDLLGRTCDYARLASIIEPWGVPVLTDSAEAMGARRDGRPAGAYGRAAVLSFNGNKVITTSGGGALVTDDRSVAERTRYLSTQARQPTVHYEHTEVGYNYRLSNLLAAMGRAQLARLPDMIERRREMRELYAAVFGPVRGVRILGSDGVHGHDASNRENYWLTSIIVDPTEAGWAAEDLRVWLAERDIEARPLWKPMHAQPAFRELTAYLDGTADRLYRDGLSLPSGSSLDATDRVRISREVDRFLAHRGAI